LQDQIVHMVMNVPVEEYPRIRTKLMEPQGGFSCQWMPLTHHNHERVCGEAKGRYQCARRWGCDDDKIKVMVLEICHQLERIRRNNFNDEVLVQSHLDGAQHLDQVERMARRNSDTQPMERVVLGFATKERPDPVVTTPPLPRSKSGV
jgi:hypothetical protein